MKEGTKRKIRVRVAVLLLGFGFGWIVMGFFEDSEPDQQEALSRIGITTNGSMSNIDLHESYIMFTPEYDTPFVDEFVQKKFNDCKYIGGEFRYYLGNEKYECVHPEKSIIVR